MKRILVLVGCVLASTPLLAGERVTGEALHALHSGKTFDMTHWKRGHGFIHFAPNGRVTLRRDSGKSWSGKWWIHDDGDKRCLQRDGKRKEFCAYVELNGDGSYALIHARKGTKVVDIHKVLDGTTSCQTDP